MEVRLCDEEEEAEGRARLSAPARPSDPRGGSSPGPAAISGPRAAPALCGTLPSSGPSSSLLHSVPEVPPGEPAGSCTGRIEGRGGHRPGQGSGLEGAWAAASVCGLQEHSPSQREPRRSRRTWAAIPDFGPTRPPGRPATPTPGVSHPGQQRSHAPDKPQVLGPPAAAGSGAKPSLLPAEAAQPLVSSDLL